MSVTVCYSIAGVSLFGGIVSLIILLKNRKEKVNITAKEGTKDSGTILISEKEE